MSVSGNSESLDIQSGDCAILMMLINNMKQLVQEILRLCREYGECRVEVDRLAVSVESVKLLACCYYYVKEEECAERARRMLEELRKMGRGEEELADVETILEELT